MKGFPFSYFLYCQVWLYIIMVDCHLSNINFFEKSNIATQEAKEGKVKDGERKKTLVFLGVWKLCLGRLGI